ncbi:MAG: AAA family ATPase [Bacteroidales bacterium]|nr:AAA family ATPase [Bacteroidales bacterium]
MKLHKLTIHNLASIEDAVIDFDAQPLAGSDVFLICGNTGSGKSTILDAICLALYGRTPRLQHFPSQNTSKSGSDTPFEERVKDARQLMRRGTGETSVTLTFEAGAGEIYTAVWEVHRSGKRADGNMQDDRRSLAVNFGNTERVFRNKKEIEAEIDKAIGLDFEQFCRTTLLAQGEFTRFLISKDEDKSQILEKITGTEIYSTLGQRVYQETARHRQEYEEVNRDVNNVVLLGDDRIAELENAIKDCEAKRKETADALTLLEGRLQWLKTDAMLSSQYAEAEKHLLAAQDSSKAAGEEIAACDRWLASMAPRQSVYANEQTIVELLRTYYSGNQKIAKETKAIAVMRDKMDGELKQRGDRLRDHSSAAEKALAEAKAAVDAAAKQKAQAEAQIAAKESELTAANTLRDTKEAVYKGIKESVGDWAKALRADLKEGDTCPVCGQLVSSHLPQEEELERLFGKAKGEFDAAAAKVKALTAEVNAMRKTVGNVEIEAWKQLDKCRSAQASLVKEKQALDIEMAACNEAIHASESLIASKKEEVADASDKVEELVGIPTSDWYAGAPPANPLSTLHHSQFTIHNSQFKIPSPYSWQTDWRTATAEFVEEMRREVKQYNDTVARRQQLVQHQRDAENEAKGRLDGIKAQLTAHRAKAERGEWREKGGELEVEISSLREALRSIDQQQGAMRQQLETDARNRRELSAKIAHRNLLLTVYRKWDRLCNLIGDQTGKKFRNIAQSYVLANLIHSANGYMKTLSERYTLHVIPETFIITVNDAWGDGQARPVSTLSGGETFLTSLALALALSDIGSHLAVDTLFIDEGFGTLSGEPLQNAVATLRSLHSQTGRHVGIISHIDELRERIPVQIQVHQDGINSASKIVITQ